MKVTAENRQMLRNIRPTPEAQWAMRLWSDEYAAQTGGSMDFWDGLTEYRKKLCQEIATLERKAVAAEAH